MSDAGLVFVNLILGAAIGIMLTVVGMTVLGATPVDIYTEVCADVFSAEYVHDLYACLDGDTIVYRFESES